MSRDKYIVIGLIVMLFNSLYQYSWNALEPLIQEDLKSGIVHVEVAFSLFTLFSTTFQIVGGHIADSRGPKKIGLVSSILSSLGFLGSSYSTSILWFYFFWSIGSIGEGILYGIASNLAIKWYKERRGLATGIVSLGFGLGATIANPLILKANSFREVGLAIGLVELAILPVLLYLSDYPSRDVYGMRVREVLSRKDWWLIYFSFVLSSVPLLVVSSSLTAIGKGLPFNDLALLITIFPLLSGASRPILGLVSDKIGRVKASLLTNTAILLGSSLLFVGATPVAVVLIGFFGGSLITLYFSLIGDFFGTRFSTSNNAVLYTGKAISGVLGSVFFSYLLTVSIGVAGLYVTVSSLLGTMFLVLFTLRRTGSGMSKSHREKYENI
ncbi:MAG: OFA family MFS transporter [Candidatus Aramenus sp.]|nr:OFA family MFS transporter [Candidatus Aramenus sp.]